tara:strand:+ start:96 stop:479 length:384 start_codon:yes stop_codon:yes gene_type:complete
MNKFLQFNEFVELGKVFKDCEAYLIALEHLNKAISLSFLPINKQRLVEAYDLRGNTKLFLSQYEGAIIDYSKAIELEPKDAYLYFFRGLSYESLELYGDALKDFQMSLKLDPDFEMAIHMIDQIKRG